MIFAVVAVAPRWRIAGGVAAGGLRAAGWTATGRPSRRTSPPSIELPPGLRDLTSAWRRGTKVRAGARRFRAILAILKADILALLKPLEGVQ